MKVNNILAGNVTDFANSKENNITDSGNNNKRVIETQQIEVENQEGNLEEEKKPLIDLIEKASGKIELEDTGLEFSIHEKTNQIMIKVIDNNTHQVIKELPSEKILDMMAKMVELSGFFVDQRG